MRMRRKVGRFGAVIAAVALATSTLTVLPSSTPPAHAQDACDPLPNPVANWSVVHDDRGVTVCYAGESGFDVAYVQIVDLAAGAKLRLISDAVDPTSVPTGSNLYRKRLTHDWFDWIQSNVTTPDAGRLLSTSNASFLVSTSGNTTPISLPEMSLQKFTVCPIPPGGCSIQHLTPGWAFADNSDPAWDADKRGLRLGSATASTQRVELFDFATHYGWGDISTAFDLFSSDGPACGIGTRCVDATVGFDPLYQVVDPVAFRTMVGIDATNKVYILNTAAGFTLSDAQDILQAFGSIAEVQLDGGRSTQLTIGDGGSMGGISSTRPVPDTLAVYLAP